MNLNVDDGDALGFRLLAFARNTRTCAWGSACWHKFAREWASERASGRLRWPRLLHCAAGEGARVIGKQRGARVCECSAYALVCAKGGHSKPAEHARRRMGQWPPAREGHMVVAQWELAGSCQTR